MEEALSQVYMAISLILYCGLRRASQPDLFSIAPTHNLTRGKYLIIDQSIGSTTYPRRARPLFRSKAQNIYIASGCDTLC